MIRGASFLLAALRSVCLLGWTFFLLIPGLMGLAAIGRAPKAIISLWYKGACAILGLDIDISGNRSLTKPVLFVSNHVSYLDILVLGRLLNPVFIAKAEVGQWPLIGLLARLTQTVFVDRRMRSSRRQRDAVKERLAAGESLVLFAEGTSSDGRRVLPFKSMLFSVVESETMPQRVAVQPVTLHYAERSGLSADNGSVASAAWYGDMTLLPHLWKILGRPGVHAQVLLHDVICPSAVAHRKELAAAAGRIVADGLHALRETRPGLSDLQDDNVLLPDRQ